MSWFLVIAFYATASLQSPVTDILVLKQTFKTESQCKKILKVAKAKIKEAKVKFATLAVCIEGLEEGPGGGGGSGTESWQRKDIPGKGWYFEPDSQRSDLIKS